MKNYRFLVPIALIAIMAISWYMLLSDSISSQSQYDGYISEARKYAAESMTKYAIENYNNAKAINDNIDLDIEVAEYYKSQEDLNEYMHECESIFKKYSKDPRAFDLIISAYYEEKDYKSCYEILSTANKRNISTNTISEIRDSIRYEYHVDYNSYPEVRAFSDGVCGVSNGETWGYVDAYGSQIISCKYANCGDFFNGIAPVTTTGDEAFFIDKEGYKSTPTAEGIIKLGMTDAIIPAKKANGKYVFVDEEYHILNETEYDYASNYNDGVAAVQVGEIWKIIDTKGNQRGEDFEDICLDDMEIASRNERLFVKKDDVYMMVDTNGNQIGSLTFEGAKVFESELPSVVKIDNMWSFITTGGSLLSEEKYSDARPFKNDLAAVCINDKWGFVAKDESIAIEPEFQDAKSFNDKGSCFVNMGNKWQLLQLYSMTEEN